ncbi:MAG: hypothetical protein ACRCTE_06620 [Cellulosilyticaceae bacterium]
MLKKLKLLGICFIVGIAAIGCNPLASSTTKLVSEELSQKEEYLLRLTGNRVLMYTLENLPKDKAYEIEVTYEVYQVGEKIKEQVITAMKTDKLGSKAKTETIALNIQQDKIIHLLGSGVGYASGSYDLEEDLSQYSCAWLTTDVDLELGTDLYIYHANSGRSTATSIALGRQATDEELNKVLKGNKVNIFIKLSFKEI